MMRARTIAAILATVVASPALAQAQAAMGPAQTIEAVAASKTGEVEGVFEFVVASGGAGGFSAYLNSAADYRDPGNLTIELHSTARNALKDKLGGHAEDVLVGKRVRVKGIARRVPVGSHFQTRIAVDSIDQIQILG
ncbi:hypothetical protein P6144_19320 [Sphingomonas sp. HITSZ_GF]|uniref:hypothetical protein n=1 Tax=Sphingomonas sp. HITSZ_GF TaxID=3037247 RepID=UPI00240DCEB4|nr:hypothetical protein [Sphingomonas sp. HITSZ_GF]MDG2535821.1 hypothetical protein [Sphingomonas sp. HITSZ_GF]